MKLLCLLMCVVALTGCEPKHTVVKKEVVTVDRPVAFIPPPPKVPEFVSQVDKLTDVDIADPGKVGQAYKYDMFVLRSLVNVYRTILNQYESSSQDFDENNKRISQMVVDINTAEDKIVKKISSD